MKIIFKISIVILLVLGINGCLPKNNDPNSSLGNSRVKGKIVIDGVPVANAQVNFDGKEEWKTSTNSNGDFEVSTLTTGDHNFSAIKQFEDNQFVQQKNSININNAETDLGTISLVKPVHLFAIDANKVDSVSIPLSWSKANSSSFKNYKIYRGASSNLLDTNGVEIFTASSNNDTTFIDNTFSTGIDNYYRVYTISNNGAVSASNIVSIKVKGTNLVSNGDFEQSKDGIIPDYWLTRLAGTPEFNYFNTTTETAAVGSHSLKISYDKSKDHPDSVWGSWGGIYTTISTNNMVVGKEYTLSFWVKADVGIFEIRLMKNNNFDVGERHPLIDEKIKAVEGWKQENLTFTIDEDTQYMELWISTGPGQSDNGIVKGYIDNVEILK